MVLSDHWLTLAVALFLPPLARIESRTGLAALRRVAVAVAAVVLVRLLLNGGVLGYDFGDRPVLNGLLPAYGVPAAAFALAAALFRRGPGGDGRTVAVLEAGAVAFATALLLLAVRHAVAGGALAGDATGTFREMALQTSGLALLAALLRLANRRRLGDRPVLRWGWRIQQGLALALGAALLAANPAFDADARVAATPVLNELLLAYGLPAALSGASAAAAPDSAWPTEFRRVLAGYAFLATLACVSLAVRHAFRTGQMALDLAPPEGAELYAYSGAWLGLGAVLLALGIRRGVPALRLAALAVMALTVGKAFLVDMAGLVGLWRVLSFLGLGLDRARLGVPALRRGGCGAYVPSGASGIGVRVQADPPPGAGGSQRIGRAFGVRTFGSRPKARRSARNSAPCATTSTGAGRAVARFTAATARSSSAGKVSPPSGV